MINFLNVTAVQCSLKIYTETLRKKATPLIQATPKELGGECVCIHCLHKFTHTHA